MSIKYKICEECNQKLAIMQFSTHNTSSDGFMNKCRNCITSMQAATNIRTCRVCGKTKGKRLFMRRDVKNTSDVCKFCHEKQENERKGMTRRPPYVAPFRDYVPKPPDPRLDREGFR